MSNPFEDMERSKKQETIKEIEMWRKLVPVRKRDDNATRPPVGSVTKLREAGLRASYGNEIKKHMFDSFHFCVKASFCRDT
jgi:hypothetical protein